MAEEHLTAKQQEMAHDEAIRLARLIIMQANQLVGTIIAQSEQQRIMITNQAQLISEFSVGEAMGQVAERHGEVSITEKLAEKINSKR